MARLPRTAQLELETLSLDPQTFGNVRENFAWFIRNGETVGCARAASEEQVEFAAGTLRPYGAMAINLVPFFLQPEFYVTGIRDRTRNHIVARLERGTVACAEPLILQCLSIEGAQYASRQHERNRSACRGQ
jgi:hypothetical protein